MFKLERKIQESKVYIDDRVVMIIRYLRVVKDNQTVGVLFQDHLSGGWYFDSHLCSEHNAMLMGRQYPAGWAGVDIAERQLNEEQEGK